MLARLLSHPSANTFDITVIVRLAEKAKKLEQFGVKAVVGSTKDTALVEKLAEEAHVVFSCVRRSPSPYRSSVDDTKPIGGRGRRGSRQSHTQRSEEQACQARRFAHPDSHVWDWYVLTGYTIASAIRQLTMWSRRRVHEGLRDQGYGRHRQGLQRCGPEGYGEHSGRCLPSQCRSVGRASRQGWYVLSPSI